MSDITYENIICEESHNGQECSFTKKVLTKLKMLFKIIVVSVAAVVTFSGCESVKEDVKQTTTIPTTSAYVQMMEEETTTIPVAEPTTQKVTQATTEAPPTTTQKITDETEAQEITNYHNITTTKKQVETTIPEKQDNEYNNLLEQLNNELSKKVFSDEVNRLFLDTFEALYNNYSGWQQGYKDLPSKKEYIKTNLIDVIKKIDGINFYKRDSKKANELLDEGLPFAWMEFDENNKIKVNIICEPSNTENTETRIQDIENFFHEIIHCKEADITLNSKYFTDNVDLEQIFTEGRSNFSYEIYKTINRKTRR